jgi:hypothetical protein
VRRNVLVSGTADEDDGDEDVSCWTLPSAPGEDEGLRWCWPMLFLSSFLFFFLFLYPLFFFLFSLVFLLFCLSTVGSLVCLPDLPLLYALWSGEKVEDDGELVTFFPYLSSSIRPCCIC